MYIRCLDCKESTLIEPSVVGPVRRVTCGTCGKKYEVPPGDEASVREQYERAQGFAAEHLIDLPSAYSVLMGIMTLEQAVALRAAAEERNKHNKNVARRPSSAAAPRVGRSWRPRSETECLLPELEATDNGLAATNGIKRAVERSSRIVRRVGDVSATLSPSQRIVATVVAVVAIVGSGVVGKGVLREPAPLEPGVKPEAAASNTPRPGIQPVSPAATPSAAPAITGESAEIMRDADGQIVRIRAADPAAVLTAFCQPESGREPLRIADVPSGEAGEDVRLGVYATAGDIGAESAIRIVYDEAGSTWTAGDGLGPVPTVDWRPSAEPTHAQPD